MLLRYAVRFDKLSERTLAELVEASIPKDFVARLFSLNPEPRHLKPSTLA